MKRGRGARECWRLRGGGRVIGEAGSGGARDWRIGVGSFVVEGIGEREDGSSGNSRQGGGQQVRVTGGLRLGMPEIRVEEWGLGNAAGEGKKSRRKGVVEIRDRRTG